MVFFSLGDPKGKGGIMTLIPRNGWIKVHYYHYMWSNDKLPSLKRSSLLAKWQSASPQYDFMLTIFPYKINLDDLAL